MKSDISYNMDIAIKFKGTLRTRYRGKMGSAVKITVAKSMMCVSFLKILTLFPRLGLIFLN